MKRASAPHRAIQELRADSRMLAALRDEMQ